MPLELPGRTAIPIDPTSDEELLEGRVIDFRFELLEPRFTSNGDPIPEAVVGTLEGVTGGDVSWSYNAAVKGAGRITVEEIGQKVNWLKARVRPVAILNDDREVPIGVFIPAAPGKSHHALGTTRTVELLDKCSLLDQDVVSDPATGMALAFSLAEGSDVMQTIISLIEEIGEAAPALPADLGRVTVRPMTWEIGERRLVIINDLLTSIGYMALWVDGMGQFQITPKVKVSERAPVYELLAPFEDGRMMEPDWSEDEDIYSIPNRFVATTQGDEENEGLAVTVILPPEDPFSYENRGRWITGVEKGVEADSVEELVRYALWRLSLGASVAQIFQIKHPILPFLRVNENVMFAAESFERAACVVYKTSVVFDPLGTCSTELGKAIEAIEDIEDP